MPSSNIFLKPPVLLAALVLVGLIALSTGLKRQASEPSGKADAIESTELDRLESGSTRISKINAPSVKSRSDASDSHGASAQKQAPRKPIVEDFEMAMKRAEGDASIIGHVVTSKPETPEDRERRRQMFERDRNTSGGRSMEDRMNWMRDRMSRTIPVENAQIFLYENDPNTIHPPLRTVVSDKEGSFTIPRLNDARQRYILVVKADKFAPEATSVEVNDGNRDVYVHLQEGVPLKGKVLDSETSEPVAGAMVYYPNPNWGAFAPLGVTTTTVSGEYSFPAVSPGRLQTQASAHGYATARARLRAPDDNSIIELQPGGASISGVTVDRLTGKPQGGARVWATAGYRVSESVISKEDGTFKIENLPEGDYTVYGVRGMKSEEQHFQLPRNESVEDVRIVLPAPVLVSGQVIHATTHKPLEGIKVYYDSPKGNQYRRTNSDGRFAFETMALDKYTITIHEKGFLPVTKTETSGSEELIERKIAPNQSSDELTIRLKPVRTLEGTVTREGGRGGMFGGFLGGFGGRAGDSSNGQANGANGENRNNKTPARDVQVTLSYVEGRDFTQLHTKSDALGNFFFNLPKTRRGDGVVVASNGFMMDAKDVRVPRNKPIELHLGRNMAFGQLLLSDQSTLDGVRVTASIIIPKKRSEAERNGRLVKISETSTMREGRLFMGLPANQDLTLTFNLPDGQQIDKPFKSSQLLRGSTIFVYDPVTKDIIADTRQRNNGGRGGGRGGNGNGRRGNPNNGGNNNPGNQPAGGQNGGQNNPNASSGAAQNMTGAPTTQ